MKRFGKNLNVYYQAKEANQKKATCHILFHFRNMTLWKRHNHRAINWLLGFLSERGINGWSTGNFWGNKIILYDTVMLDTFIETYKMYLQH